LKEPALRVRIIGQAPVQATVYELARLRCNLCQEVYEAPAPNGTGADKRDETAASMVAVLKYGSGVPFYRLAGLQDNLGIPLPVSTQWDMMAEAAAPLEPAYAELIRQAAKGKCYIHIMTTRRRESWVSSGRLRRIAAAFSRQGSWPPRRAQDHAVLQRR
jgi:hypothetical protein